MLAAVLLIAAFGSSRADDASRVAALRAVYAKEQGKLSKELATRRKAVMRVYGEKLAVLEKHYQRAGELEFVLAVRSERSRFDGDRTIEVTAGSDLPAALRQLQRDCRETLDAAQLENSRTLIRLTDRYVSHLEGLVKQLTRDNKMEQALNVRQEVEAVKVGEAYQAAVFAVADHDAAAGRRVADDTPVVSPSPSVPAGGFSVVWRPRSGNTATVSAGGRKRTVSLKQVGRNQALPSGLACQGGRTFVDGVGDELAAACKQSNELTIGIALEAEDLEQSGPARILSCSRDGHNRNFSLCQERENFVLRLRTTETGLNGTSPEVRLCPIRAREEMTLVIAYRPGELKLHCDGREVPVRQIGGDFSNWEEYALLLGNECKSERAWSGRILRFFVADRCLGKMEAQRLLAR